MLLNKKVLSEREDRKVIAGRETTKWPMVVLMMVSQPGSCSSFRPPKPTDVLYILGGKEHFPPPVIHNPDTNKSSRLQESRYEIQR